MKCIIVEKNKVTLFGIHNRSYCLFIDCLICVIRCQYCEIIIYFIEARIRGFCGTLLHFMFALYFYKILFQTFAVAVTFSDQPVFLKIKLVLLFAIAVENSHQSTCKNKKQSVMTFERRKICRHPVINDESNRYLKD